MGKYKNGSTSHCEYFLWILVKSYLLSLSTSELNDLNFVDKDHHQARVSRVSAGPCLDLPLRSQSPIHAAGAMPIPLDLANLAQSSSPAHLADHPEVNLEKIPERGSTWPLFKPLNRSGWNLVFRFLSSTENR